MPFKVQVGPRQISIHQGQTVLVSEPDGQINWPSEKGLYFLDTRVVSSWTIYANGEPWDLLNGGAVTHYVSRIYLTNRRIPTMDGVIPQRTLGLILSRSINGGMHEDIDITNYGTKRVSFQLEISLRCDFADIFEVKSSGIVRRGRITTKWTQAKQRLRTIYRNGDFVRAVTVAPERQQTRAVYANGRLSFEIEIDPGASWHSCLFYTLTDGERTFAPLNDCVDQHHKSRHAETLSDWLRSVLRIRTSNIDIYHMHGFDALTPVEETLYTLDTLTRSGKVRYIACSNFSGWHLMKSLAASERNGWVKYISHQVYYSLVGRDYEWELMPLALDQRIGAMIWSPLGWGRLTGKIRRGQPLPQETRLKTTAEMGPPVDEERLYRIVDAIDAIARETGKSVPDIALNWILRKPTVSSVIIGARNEEQLRQNLAAAEWSLTPEQVARFDEASEHTLPYPYWHQRQFIERNPPPPAYE
jgi:aryl-alcohol dehydrogenase-like predicted oxidoreductase